MPGTGLTGSLKTMSLPDLLQWASSGRKTGTLSLKSGPLHKKIYLQVGAIIGSSSNDTREYLGQFMLSEGIITEQQLKDAFDLQAQTRVMLGRILVKKGLVSEQKVSEILRMKTEETIYSLFLWTDADFEFTQDELPPGEQVLISIKVEDVLMEGLRRTTKKLPSEIASKTFPKRVYDLIDGRRTLAETILEAHASEYNVCQIVFVMVQKGYLEIGERTVPAPARPAADTPQAMLEAAKELIKSGDSETALTILEKARRTAGKNPEMNALIQVAEEHFIDKAYRHYLPPKKVPILRKSLESLVSQDLSPEEGFLVSRVNGSWDLRSIISISPMREVDALRAFKKLRERGIIDLVEGQAKSA
jgi:hypothetical protein